MNKIVLILATACVTLAVTFAAIGAVYYLSQPQHSENYELLQEVWDEDTSIEDQASVCVGYQIMPDVMVESFVEQSAKSSAPLTESEAREFLDDNC